MEGTSYSNRGPSPLLIRILVGLILLPCFVFLGARAILPADGTKVVFDVSEAHRGGLTIKTLSKWSGLRAGDQVLAIEGRSPDEWLRDSAAFGRGTAIEEPQATLEYLIRRDGGIQTVQVNLRSYPWLSALADHWSMHVFLLYLLLIGVLVFLRRPHLSAAKLFVVLSAITFSNGTVFNLGLQTSDLARPWIVSLWLFQAVFLDAYIMAGLLHFALIFPRRRMLDRHPVLLAGVYSGMWLVYGGYLALRWSSEHSPTETLLLLIQGTFVMPVVYITLVLWTWTTSYRTSHNPRERRQLRWVVWGAVVGLVPFMALSLVPSALGIGGALGGNFALVGVFLCALPTACTIAILREQLFDIDVIINRTLVYSSLSVLLAIIYFGGVAILQMLSHAVLGQQGQSSVAIVVSTLLIASVIQPLRRHIQALIDRRFFRRKYNAARTLQSFSITVRDEVDLDDLRMGLLTVVHDTLQPAHATLWLRPLDHEESPAP